MNQPMSNLYLVIFPEKLVLKIGKANDIANRLSSLSRHWGEADYKQSYYIELPEPEVYRIEKSLHYLLESHAVTNLEGDGQTELFQFSALEPALQHIKLYLKSKPTPHQIIQGLPQAFLETPTTPKNHPNRRKRRRALQQVNRFHTSMSANLDKINRLQRILIILKYKSHRIAYQHDIINGQIYFRIQDGITNEKFQAMVNLMRCLSYRIEFGTVGVCGINLNTVIQAAEDLVQFVIRIPTEEDNLSKWNYIEPMFSECIRLYEALPSRSKLVHKDLPILD